MGIKNNGISETQARGKTIKTAGDFMIVEVELSEQEIWAVNQLRNHFNPNTMATSKSEFKMFFDLFNKILKAAEESKKKQDSLKNQRSALGKQS